MSDFKLLLSELVGTLILVMLGNGVVYSVSGKRMFANQPGKWIVIALGWGLAVLVGVITAKAISPDAVAHLNPAVTFFGAMSGKNAFLLAAIPMQFIGAILGQIVLDFINWKHIQESDLGTVRGSHCTGPAFANKEKATIFNFSYELVGTLMLVGILLALGKNGNATDYATWGAMPVALLVMAIGVSLGSSTGYAINPARDLGPRLVYFVLERTLLAKRKDEWVGANWGYSWVPVIAPSVAGVIMGGISLATA